MTRKRAASHCDIVVVKPKGLHLLAICLIKNAQVSCEECCGILHELLATDADSNVRNMATDLQILLC